MMRKVNLLRLACIGAIGLGGVMGCNPGDVVSIPSGSDPNLYWALDTGPGGITLAVGATHRLVPVARGANGTTLQTNAPMRYSTIDSTKVAVDADGTLRAKAVASGVRIIVEMAMGAMTKADTVFVNVTPQAHRVKTFKLAGSFGLPLQTLAGLNQSISLGYTAVDDNDIPISDLSVEFESTDKYIVTVFSFPGFSSASGFRLGRAKVVASTMSYGTVYTDTAEITIQYPTSANVMFQANWTGNGYYFQTPGTPIGVGSSVSFTNYASAIASVDAIFDNPSAVVGGNVVAMTPFIGQSRTFNTPGTYTFKDPVSGATGSIIVKPQPTY